MFSVLSSEKVRNEHININDRYRHIPRQEADRALTPVGESVEPLPVSPATSSTLKTKISVEAVNQVPDKDQAPVVLDQLPNEAGSGPPVLDTEITRPVGPKPAKVVDADAINMSAFIHFAPKTS